MSTDFGLLDPYDESGLWDDLYNEPGAAFERIHSSDVWLNSDNDLRGPVIMYENNLNGTVALHLYVDGAEVADTELAEPEDWFAGPYDLVVAFAAAMTHTKEVTA